MQGTWTCLTATALYTPGSIKQETPSGPAEIAHLVFLAERLSVLCCRIRTAAGCWAMLGAFRRGHQQGQNAKDGIVCLYPQQHRAELRRDFTFTRAQQKRAKCSARKPILPKHIRAEGCSGSWTNSAASFTCFFFSSLGGCPALRITFIWVSLEPLSALKRSSFQLLNIDIKSFAKIIIQMANIPRTLQETSCYFAFLAKLI